jgi:hypothetical protein
MKTFCRWSGLVWCSLLLCLASSVVAQPDSNRGPRVYRDKVEAHWFADNRRFWYRNDLRGGAREFIVVDAERGTRQPAFDHAAVARQLGAGVTAEELPVTGLQFSADGTMVTLRGDGTNWIWHLQESRLGEANASGAAPTSSESNRLPAEARPRPSTRTGAETQISFVNELRRAGGSVLARRPRRTSELWDGQRGGHPGSTHFQRSRLAGGESRRRNIGSVCRHGYRGSGGN